MEEDGGEVGGKHENMGKQREKKMRMRWVFFILVLE